MRPEVVDHMLKFAGVGPRDVLYALGCGDGTSLWPPPKNSRSAPLGWISILAELRKRMSMRASTASRIALSVCLEKRKSISVKRQSSRSFGESRMSSCGRYSETATSVRCPYRFLRFGVLPMGLGRAGRTRIGELPGVEPLSLAYRRVSAQ